MSARGAARWDKRVAIVGAGVMAEAMIAGLLADKAVPASRLVASHPRRDRREQLSARHGIKVVTRNGEAIPGADIVVLAVKPQMLRSVMREVGPALAKDQVVLSIVAGATLRTLTTGLDHAAVVRAMPNTPSQINFISPGVMLPSSLSVAGIVCSKSHSIQVVLPGQGLLCRADRSRPTPAPTRSSSTTCPTACSAPATC